MRLREFVDSRGLLQAAICRMAVARGRKLRPEHLCAIMNGRLKLQPRLAQTIRDALIALHGDPKVVAGIDEFRPFDLEAYPAKRLPKTPKGRSPPSAPGKTGRSPLSRGDHG